MSTHRFLAALVAISTLIFAVPLTAQSAAGKLTRVTAKDAAWAAKARQSYPLGVCLTSDEKLGSMGKSPEYVYRVAGQPDRLVIFCCEGCEDDFAKEPAKFIAKLDAAANAKAAPGNPAGSAKDKSDHKAHKHE